MAETTKEVLESFEAFVEGEQGLDGVQDRLEGASLDQVKELYEEYSDELAQEDPAREALLESLLTQDDLEDQDPRRRPASPPGGPDPDH
jgi:hypothetical protein